MNVGEIAADLRVHTGEWTAGLRQAAAEARRFSTDAEQSLAQVQRGWQSFSRHALQVGVGIGVYQMFTRVLGAAKSAFMGYNSTLEQATIGFTTMLGSAEKATTFLKSLEEFAVKTPFQFTQLVGLSQQMLAMGFSFERLMPSMKAIGDAVAALGGSPYIMERVIRALGQMQAKGKVSMEEARQLAEAGIPAIRYLAEATGRSMAEISQGSKKVYIDAETGIRAIIEGMQRDFGGMMEAQSKTLQGAMSNLVDFSEQVAGRATKPLYEAVKKGILAVANAAQTPDAKKAIDNFAAAADRGLRTVFAAIGSGWQSVRGQVMGVLESIQQALKGAVEAAKSMSQVGLGAFVVTLRSAVDVLYVLAKALAPIIELLGRQRTLVQAVFTAWLAWKGLHLLLGLLQAGMQALAKAILSVAVATSQARLAGLGDQLASAAAGAQRFGLALSQSDAVARQSVMASGGMAASLATKLHPALLAVTGAMAVATPIIVQWWQAKQRARQEVQAYTDAIVADTQALKENAAAQVTGVRDALLAGLGEKTIERLNDLGITYNDIIGKFKQGTGPTREWVASLIKVDVANSKLRLSAQEVERITAEVRRLYTETGKINIGKALENLGYSGNRMAAMVGGLKVAPEIQELARELAKMEKGSRAAAEVMEFLGSKTKATAESVKQLIDSFSQYYGVTTDFSKQWANVNVGIVEIKTLADAMDTVSQVAQVQVGDVTGLRAAWDEAHKAIQQVIDAYMATPDGALKAQEATRQLMDEFYRQAAAAGWSKDQVDKLLESLGVLDALKALNVDINVNVSQAMANLEKVTGAMDSLLGRLATLDPEMAGRAGQYLNVLGGSRIRWENSIRASTQVSADMGQARTLSTGGSGIRRSGGGGGGGGSAAPQKSAEQIAAEWRAAERYWWEVRIETGEKGADEYLGVLQRQLDGLEKYSQEWMDIWRKINQLTKEQVDKLGKTLESRYKWGEIDPATMKVMQGIMNGDPKLIAGLVGSIVNESSNDALLQTFSKVITNSGYELPGASTVNNITVNAQTNASPEAISAAVAWELS